MMTEAKVGWSMLVLGVLVIGALALALVSQAGGELSEKRQTIAYGCGYIAHQLYLRRAPADDLPEWCRPIKETAKRDGFDLP